MTYREISSEVVVAKIENDYDVTGVTDWVTRVGEWIADAMAIIDMPLSYRMMEPYEMTIVARKGKLPCNVERVLYITKDGKAMSYITDGAMRQPNADIEISGMYYYEYTRSGHIITNFNSGTVYVYYRGLNTAYNPISKMHYPYVPYNRVLLKALEAYVIHAILIKGGTVTGQSLSNNNPFTNPALAWESSLPKVRIELMGDFDEAMENVDNMSKGFIRPIGTEGDKRDYLNELE